MLSSMTGYGRGQAALNGISVEVEAKSLNSRFLEITFKLPKRIQNKEYELKELVKKSVSRGKLYIVSNSVKDGLESGKLILDPAKVNSVNEMLKELKKLSKSREAIGISHLLSFQDFIFAENEEESQLEFELTAKALQTALEEMNAMRKNEGKELELDLRKRIDIIKNSVKSIEELRETSTEEHYEKIRERVKKIVGDIAEYNDRLEQEIAFLCERADITEECVRLNSHIKYFIDALENGIEPGRKLNFLCQEINREANTIGNKTVSAEIAYRALSIKEELEKIREQVQNIE